MFDPTGASDAGLRLGDRVRFVPGDLRSLDDLRQAVRGQDAVVHLAADTRVMDSIEDPAHNFDNNVIGTFNLLQSARSHWEKLSSDARQTFRFVHVSTDEVFGALGREGRFDEKTPYDPRSPYSASRRRSAIGA